MPKKLEKPQAKQSPYQLLNQWLFDGDIQTALPETWVFQSINICMFLQSFSMCGEITVYLNEIFNNYNIYQINKEEFFLYLKKIIIEKRIKREKMCFFKHQKEDKDITLIHSKLPQLKRYEIGQFLVEIENDTDMYDAFLITLGLKEEKKQKLTSSEKKNVQERLNKMKEQEKLSKVSIDSWTEAFS